MLLELLMRMAVVKSVRCEGVDACASRPDLLLERAGLSWSVTVALPASAFSLLHSADLMLWLSS